VPDKKACKNKKLRFQQGARALPWGDTVRRRSAIFLKLPAISCRGPATKRRFTPRVPLRVDRLFPAKFPAPAGHAVRQRYNRGIPVAQSGGG